MAPSIPVIDASALFTLSKSSSPSPEAFATAHELYAAASTWGFFQLTNHSVSPSLQSDLLKAAQTFFALPDADKLALDVRNGGLAWRGYMPLGGEGTHGRVDPLLGMPLHGKNQFPSEDQVPGMRSAVLEYIAEVTKVGVAVVAGLSLGLGLEAEYLKARLLEPEPVALFRCFKYATCESSAGEQVYAQWHVLIFLQYSSIICA
jgi:isopenicillin N synthase-like dioxygenase